MMSLLLFLYTRWTWKWTGIQTVSIKLQHCDPSLQFRLQVRWSATCWRAAARNPCANVCCDNFQNGIVSESFTHSSLEKHLRYQVTLIHCNSPTGKCAQCVLESRTLTSYPSLFLLTSAALLCNQWSPHPRHPPSPLAHALNGSLAPTLFVVWTRKLACFLDLNLPVYLVEE